MASDPERSSVVGKLVLYPVSKKVMLIFEDGRTEVFGGPNFYRAQTAAEKSSQGAEQSLELVDERDFGTIVIVPKDVLVETAHEK